MSPSPPIRVVLADDHIRIHEALTIILEAIDDIVLVGQASNGEEAVQLCEQLRPDLILMDIAMPYMNGAEATRLIHQKFPDIKILVLSSFQDDEAIHVMLENGAIGYVLKASLAHNLADTIRTAYSGKSVFSKEITQVLLRVPPQEKPHEYGLTRRELEILKLVAEGMNNGEIAALLVISQSTVKFHVANIVQKMGVETRSEAIVLAAKNGLI